MLRTLDKVEDMRLATLEAGVDWDFETYGEYLDAVARRGTVINFGGYVGHTPVRIYVMGDDAYERKATDDEITRMKQVVADSLNGGALGFSSDRGGFHIGDGGRPVPSIMATQEETEALMRVTGEIDRGMIHVAPGENYDWVYDFQKSLGRTITWSSILTYPPEWKSRAPFRGKLDRHTEGRRSGADVWVQVTCRPIVQQILDARADAVLSDAGVRRSGRDSDGRAAPLVPRPCVARSACTTSSRAASGSIPDGRRSWSPIRRRIPSSSAGQLASIAQRAGLHAIRRRSPTSRSTTT